MRDRTLPCPVLDLVPHRPPMLWIGELDAFSEDEGRASGKVAAANPLVDSEGFLHPVASIELVAQAAAAQEGYRSRLAAERPRNGMLVGVRDFTFQGRLRAGERFEVVTRRGFSLEAIRAIEGAVFAGGRRVASGEIRLYLGEQAASSDRASARETSGPTLPAHMGSILPLAGRWVTGVDVEGARASFFLDATFPAFHGHYPDNPLLPAVVAVLLGVETRTILAGVVSTTLRVGAAKFTRPVRTGAALTVVLEGAALGSSGSWIATVHDSGEAVAKILFEDTSCP